MLVKTSELIGPALDWAVAKCEGIEVKQGASGIIYYAHFPKEFSPPTDWAQGGPIIEREGIGINKTVLNGWIAEYDCALTPETEHTQLGQTPLIAAMRCFVMSKLGDTVEIPAELE